MRKIELKSSKSKKRFNLLALISIAFLVVLLFLQVILSNRLASYGEELSALSKEENTLSLENELLLREIASQSAIATIAQKAQEMSFVSPTKFLIAQEEEPVALAK